MKFIVEHLLALANQEYKCDLLAIQISIDSITSTYMNTSCDRILGSFQYSYGTFDILDNSAIF